MRTINPQPSWKFLLYFSLFVVPLFSVFTISKHHFAGDRALASWPTHSAWNAYPHATRKLLRTNADKDLLFDPVLVYATFLGGASSANPPFDILQTANVILIDAAGNLYVAGSSNSRSFPVTPSVVEPNNPQKNQLGFLVKLDPTGSSLIFSTYIDGIVVSAMAMDANGNIYVAGSATQPNRVGIPVLPIPQGSTPFQATPRSIGILKLNSTATTVLAATYLGGSGNDTVTGLAVEPGNATSNLYVTGSTGSNDFPTQGALQSSLGSSNNVFVTALNPTLSAAVYSTYLGKSSIATSGTGPHAIAVDTAGDAYVVGTANSGFPTTAGAIQTACPDGCSFVSKLNPAGSTLLYSTYFGTGFARANAVAVDSSKNVYLEGSAALSSGITAVNPVPGFFPCTTPNVGSGFVSEITASGSLAFSTCVVGSTSTIALDGSGNISITGTAGTGFPLHNPVQSNAPDTGAPFIATINPNTSSLLFSSFLGDGQGGNPAINDIAVDSAGDVYAAGYGNTFPVFNALQSVPAGGDPPCPVMNPCVNGSNVDILKIAPTNAAAAALSTASLTFPAQSVGTPSASQAVTIVDLGSASLTVSNATATGDFSVQDGCTSPVAPAGGTCALQLTFTPTALGTRTGTLTIADSSAGSPRTVQLTGSGGQAAAMLSPNPLSLSQAINTTTTSPVTLTNSGTLPLQISTIHISGATFSETNNCGSSVGAGQSCQIKMTFSPTAVGNSTGTLTVTDNAADSPQTVALTGAGVADNIGLVYPPNNGLSSSTTPAGSVAITTIQVGGAGLSGTVNFSCSGLPQGASCSFSPSTVQMKPTVPSQMQLTITTTARSHLFVPIGLITAFLTLAILASLIFFKTASTFPTPCPRWRLLPLFALALCACGGGSGGSSSGGSSSSTGTPAGNYTVVITATSGSATQTVNFALTVQ